MNLIVVHLFKLRKKGLTTTVLSLVKWEAIYWPATFVQLFFTKFVIVIKRFFGVNWTIQCPSGRAAMKCWSKFCYIRKYVKIRTYFKKEFTLKIKKTFNSLTCDLANIQMQPNLKAKEGWKILKIAIIVIMT